ncbi:hypothetical protein C408_4221 [Vibrio diabolicus E0666]|nr:hypothetical protein C408_4221 [Vibrio diabolicus E0666]
MIYDTKGDISTPGLSTSEALRYKKSTTLSYGVVLFGLVSD